MIKCVICNQEFEENSFAGHPYKQHKVTAENYFLKYYNKKDLFTNERIPFKNIHHYLSSDFINKNNFRCWIKANSKDAVREYCLNWLSKRKSLRNLRYAPSQVELKTLVFPNINYLDKLFENDGGYYKLCYELGYFLRHKKLDKNSVLPIKFEYSNNLKIIKDTRESKPLIFDKPNEIATLDWGDYALSREDLSCKTRIERKSLPDLIGTLSSGYDRFSREIERADKDKGYVVVLVEDSFDHFLTFNYLPYISKKIKATPEFISHRMRELCQYFDNLQFLCVEGRKEAARIVTRIFQLGEETRNIDLQLAYDLGLLN